MNDLSLAKEKLGLESWLLLLWLLAEPLSLDGDAKGAEIQLPAHICIESKVSSKSIHGSHLDRLV